jgi:NHLM bacteriocin system ABC transporter peptidase/ATP-binding protein
MEAVECGAASLAMVLAYHGRWESLEQLRLLCGVSRDGSKALNLVKAARGLGLTAKGMRLEPERLHEIPLPAILFVNMNHFVVLEGTEPGWAWLNDPASGRRKVSIDEFDAMFSGIVLVFEKGPDFQPQGQPPQVLKAFWRMVRGSGSSLRAIVALGLLTVFVAMVVPAFSRVFIDQILIEGLNDWLTPLLVAMAVAAITLTLATWLREHLVSRLHVKLGLVLSGRLGWHILRLPSQFFMQRHSAMVSARMPLAEHLSQLASRNLSQMVISGTSLVFFTTLMLQYHPVLTLVSVLLAAVNVLTFTLLRRRLGEASEMVALQGVKMEGKVMQGLQMIETLKATGADEAFFAKWAGLQALFINAQQRIAHLQSLLATLPMLTAGLTSALVLALGGFFVMQDELSIGMLVAYTALLAAFSTPISDLMATATAIRNAQGQLAQVEDTLKHPLAPEFCADEADQGQIETAATRPRTSRLPGHIQLQAVSAGYSPLEPPLLDGLSLDMPPGSRIALVGGSGSGKSTIGRLISGLMEPSSGLVLFDGLPASAWPRELLRSSLAVVDQEILLFEGSIRDNLSLWDNTMPLDRIVQAAKDAMIHEVIEGRKGGYNGWVEENGRNFSGGQRQRLELARALTGNPSVLILDEATSALDTLSEEAIMTNLRRRGCTCIIIAHRLSTIRDCDEIIVLDHGHIAERGTHQQLIQLEGIYHGLIEN